MEIKTGDTYRINKSRVIWTVTAVADGYVKIRSQGGDAATVDYPLPAYMIPVGK